MFEIYFRLKEKYVLFNLSKDQSSRSMQNCKNYTATTLQIEYEQNKIPELIEYDQNKSLKRIDYLSICSRDISDIVPEHQINHYDKSLALFVVKTAMFL